MYISKIEEGKGNKYKIYSDYDYLFALYKSELKRFSITEGCELSEEVYQTILEEVVYKRAKERALFLLESRPYTAYKLTMKLKESGYPDCILEQVLLFLEKYHYIDDYEYARMYIESYANKKSKKALQFDLQKKGIHKDITNQVLSELDYSENQAIDLLMDKYLKGKDLKDPKIKDKTIRYFMGKGYSYANIQSFISKKMGND